MIQTVFVSISNCSHKWLNWPEKSHFHDQFADHYSCVCDELQERQDTFSHNLKNLADTDRKVKPRAVMALLAKHKHATKNNIKYTY